MITAEAVIDLQALRNNYNKLKAQCNSEKLVAVIKGDAYGHNAVKVAQALSEADMFAVSRTEEAAELREAGIDQPILLLEGCFCSDELKAAASMNLQTTIHCAEQLEDLKQTQLENKITVWLKLDTGMHRLGVQPDELAHYVAQIQNTNQVRGDIGFISHFSCADDLSSPATLAQMELFKAYTAPYPGPKTLANSAGIFYWKDSHFNVSRAGIALYGISPIPDKQGYDHDLTPVMTLNSRLIAVRKHQAHQPVGYGALWESKQATHIGVIALGYGDGYPRSTPAGTPVYINGRVVPVVGRISMDMITVDLGPDATDKVGDLVEFWGKHLPVEEIARHIGTIPYELVIQLTKRVTRTFIPK
ncbi:Alanine racemase, biosynthetic [Vibrio aerogenes CECT 7868]|uniref:Alanine racemase n=1 Tax=Vibrio aerogenes CECT 7868 TaxID=1216006 RepID=A0A1M6CCJ8_9VIBR|nr:alanine racemase [Vibrio aerogenes]SHI58775.1 Alanine racemase, biosynthetic [Vibrio aerogenes CECT 7868]